MPVEATCGETMYSRRRDGAPVWISGSLDSASPLRRVNLKAEAQSSYNEDWLQDFLHRNPEVFPIAQIEPGLGTPIAVCRELPLTLLGGRTVALDNLFVTPQGQLLLIEAKLWRNPEARRAAVAQAIEYAAAVFRMSYEQLQHAILRSISTEGLEAPKSLYELAKAQLSETSEEEFIDAVSLNLRRGRAIIAVVGDGIREELTSMAELLQSHAGHRFTFALVELAIYETPVENVRIVVPSVLAQTALIERGVVHIEDIKDGGTRITVRDPFRASTVAAKERSIGIGEDEFYDHLEQRMPGSSNLVKSFLSKAEPLGIRIDRRAALNLKHNSPIGNDLNVGTIDKYGFIDTVPSTWWGRTEQGSRYNQALAEAIGGKVVPMKNGEQSVLRTAAGKTPRISDLLPMHEDVWLSAIENYVKDIFEKAGEGQ